MRVLGGGWKIGGLSLLSEYMEKILIDFIIWGGTDLSKTETKLNSSLSSLPPFHKPSSAQETNAVLQQSVGHPQHDAILAIVLGASLVECQSSKSPRKKMEDM